MHAIHFLPFFLPLRELLPGALRRGDVAHRARARARREPEVLRHNLRHHSNSR